MKLDILFIDIACSKPYDWESLEEDSLGGTESSTIRLAEGFASKGHSVCVIQKFDFVAKQSPNGVYYAPLSWMKFAQPRNVIHLRFRGLIDKFPKARQFIWFHDAASELHNNPTEWPTFMAEYNVQGIAVSDWHVKNIHSYAPTMPLKRIYSPVDELCYDYPRADKVDVDQLVWMSSPHKGLAEALQLFALLRERSPEFKLAVFNPGYYEEDQGLHSNVIFLPKLKRKAIRSVVSRSLALFYPTMFEETFGLVAAEANALGTPVATFPVAALAESCGNEFAKDTEDIIEKMLLWRRNRPNVKGQDLFRFVTIYPEWLKLLDL